MTETYYINVLLLHSHLREKKIMIFLTGFHGI